MHPCVWEHQHRRCPTDQSLLVTDPLTLGRTFSVFLSTPQEIFYWSYCKTFTSELAKQPQDSLQGIGIGDGTCRNFNRSISGKFRGGSEKWPYVELPFLSSCIVNSAATVLLKMLCSAAAAACCSPLSASSCAAGNMASIMFSHSFTSIDMRSVVKNGSFSTFAMNGSRNKRPVLLSYFFKILARPGKIQCIDKVHVPTWSQNFCRKEEYFRSQY